MGGQKKTKVEFQLACKLIPFSWLAHFQKVKFLLCEVLPLDVTFLTKYTKKILKITREKSGKRIFQFLNLNTLKDI